MHINNNKNYNNHNNNSNYDDLMIWCCLYVVITNIYVFLIYLICLLFEFPKQGYVKIFNHAVIQ